MGEGRKRLESERERRKKGRRHVIEVRIRGEQCCLVFTCFSFLPSQLMCLSVPVYRRITLCKHCAFALNRQHKILTANVFLIRGYSGQSHTVWESDWESNRPFIYHGRAPLCPCACACSYYNGSKLCMTLARFLPFKSCFWEGTAAVRSQTATCAAAAGWGVRSDEAWAGTEYSGYGYLGQKYLGKQCYQCLES